MTAQSGTDWRTVRDEAALWVVRMSGPHDPTDKIAFDSWLAADLAHEIAYEQELATWKRVGDLGDLRKVGRTVDEGLAEPRPAKRASKVSRYGRRAILGGALAAASAGVAVLMFDGGAKAYATEKGERRKIRLKNAGAVELNTETRLTVRESRSGCHVEVASGECMFDLDTGARRPFEVRVGRLALTGARGRFSLRHHAGQTRVVMLDGVVDLVGADRPMRLSRGVIADVTLRGALSHAASAEELNRGLSWREGRIILSGETLAEAAAEFNRYNSRPIIVDDPSITAISVGGSFDADKPAEFVRAVEASFGVQAIETATGFRLGRAD